MAFHWSLGESKSAQVSRTLLSIIAELNNAVIWMVSACPSISNSSRPLTKPLGIFPSAPITIGITVTFMLYWFLVLWLCLGTCLSSYNLWFFLCGLAKRQSLLFGIFPFLLLIITTSDLISVMRWSVCIKNPRESCMFHFLGRILDCAYNIW